jgi:hypothetical protein
LATISFPNWEKLAPPALHGGKKRSRAAEIAAEASMRKNNAPAQLLRPGRGD